MVAAAAASGPRRYHHTSYHQYITNYTYTKNIPPAQWQWWSSHRHHPITVESTPMTWAGPPAAAAVVMVKVDGSHARDHRDPEQPTNTPSYQHYSPTMK